MSHPYKKHQVKFCPMCGGDVVTHLGQSAFLCGHNDPEKEAAEKVERTSERCNRTFQVMRTLSNSEFSNDHRRKIGAAVSRLRDDEIELR